jgi:hypothetical protein
MILINDLKYFFYFILNKKWINFFIILYAYINIKETNIIPKFFYKLIIYKYNFIKNNKILA